MSPGRTVWVMAMPAWASSARRTIRLAGRLPAPDLGNVTGNMIQGNLIGLDVTGANSLGNGDAGVGIISAANNQVGGTTTGTRSRQCHRQYDSRQFDRAGCHRGEQSG